MTTQNYSRFGPYAGAMAAVTSPDIDKTVDDIRKALIACRQPGGVVGFPDKEGLRSFIEHECKQRSLLPPITRARFEPVMTGGEIVAWDIVSDLHYP